MTSEPRFEFATDMIIKCPQCTATYDVPSAAAVQGRKVRCTRCSHVWRAEVMEGEASPAAVPPTASASAVPKTQALGQPVQAAAAAPPPAPAPLPVAAPPPAPLAPAPAAASDVPRTQQRSQPALAPTAPPPMPELGERPMNGRKPPLDAGLQDAPALAAMPPRAEPRPQRSAVREAPPALGAPEPPLAKVNGRPELTARRSDAWDEVETSLNKVTSTTRQRPRTEQRPPEPEFTAPPPRNGGAQPRHDRQEVPASRSRNAVPDDDWTAAANARPTQRPQPQPQNGHRPELDDEQFWRERTAQAEPQWPTPRGPDTGFIEEAAALPPRSSQLLVTGGWLLFAGILAGLMTFLYVGRTSVVAALPGAAPIYAKAGLPINIRGLEFRDIAYKWGLDRRGRPAMTISGKVINISSTPQTVPSVAFVFLDDQKAELFNWATRIREKPLDPGKSTSFEARIPAPPEAVANLQVRFAKAR